MIRNDRTYVHRNTHHYSITHAQQHDQLIDHREKRERKKVTFPGAFEELGAASKQLLAADAEEAVLLLQREVADAAAVAIHLAVQLLLLLGRAVLLVLVVVVASSSSADRARALLHRDHRRDVPHLLESPRLQRRRASQRYSTQPAITLH